MASRPYNLLGLHMMITVDSKASTVSIEQNKTDACP